MDISQSQNPSLRPIQIPFRRFSSKRRAVDSRPLGRAKDAPGGPANELESVSSVTIPCQVISSSDDRKLILKEAIHWYQTGETLGSGKYGILKEALHIKTGKYYTCKIIDKKLVKRRDFIVRLRPIFPLLGHDLYYRCRSGMRSPL